MKSLTSMLMALALTIGGVACDLPNEGATKVGTTTKNQTTVTTAMEAVYVSGHLGNTWDCANEGVSFNWTAPASKADAAGAPREAGARFGDCAEDGCGGPLNCEDARVMLKLTNTGEVALTELEVTDVQMLDAGGEFLVDLPVASVTITDGDETLIVGEEATLRVEFEPPRSQDFGGEFFGSAGAKLRIIVLSKEGANVDLVTPEVQILPAVAT